MTPLSVKKLEKIFPELQPVIQEQIIIRKLPNINPGVPYIIYNTIFRKSTSAP